MGMYVSVYKNVEFGNDEVDCTNGGITSRYNRLCLTNVEGPWEPGDDAPAAKLMPGNLPGTLKIVPDEVANNWHMMGGNYAATSDSRFTEACKNLLDGKFYGAVPVHDRVEG